MKNESLNLQEMQELVSEMVKRYNLETSPEMRYIDLTSEMGGTWKGIIKGF